jgi:hypothetical protein
VIHLTESLYHDQQAAIRIAGETTEWFEVQKGVRQGCIRSPNLFNIYAEHIMRNSYDDNYLNYDPFTIGGNSIPELRYADDTVLLLNSNEALEQLIVSIKKHSEDQNLYLKIRTNKANVHRQIEMPTQNYLNT